MSVRFQLKSWAGDGARFILAGALNTLLTLAVYQALLFVLPSWTAYTLSWVTGLLFVIVFYPSRVFGDARRDARARATLGTCYAAVFVTGLIVLRLTQQASIPPRIAIFGVLLITTAANFILSRLILTKWPLAK